MNRSAWKKSLEKKKEGRKRRPKVSRFNYSFQDEVQMQECDPLGSRPTQLPPPPCKKARSPTKLPDVSFSNSGKSSHLQSQFSTRQTVFPGLVSYKCQICRDIFQDKFHLLRHQKTHTGEKPYNCLRCGKAFSRKDKFVEHKLIHTRKTPFPCPECGQCFSIGNYSLKHLRTYHEEMRLNQCSQCGKSFALVSKLKKHQKIHRGKELHQCPTCGKNFHWRNVMRRHQKVHGRTLQRLESFSGQETASTDFLKNPHRRIQQTVLRPGRLVEGGFLPTGSFKRREFPSHV